MNLNEVNNYTINTFQQMPNIPQNCCYKLINENEIVWKLLKYTDSDAWKKPDLTRAEKAKMIYDGKAPQDDYNVFLDYFMDESTNK